MGFNLDSILNSSCMMGSFQLKDTKFLVLHVKYSLLELLKGAIIASYDYENN